MRFERYEVIVRKLENVCIEYNIHDEFSISKTIHEFDMLTRPYFDDDNSDIHSYDNEGYDIYNISIVVNAFRWFLTNKSEFKKLLEIEGYICRINLENKLFDLMRFEYNEDYYRYCEKLCCLFNNMFVSKIEEYEIDVVKNGLGTLMYNKLEIVGLFKDFMSYIDEYEIDVDLALEHMRKGA